MRHVPAPPFLRIAAAVALALLTAAAAEAKSYTAERFDVAVRLLPEAVLEVTETIRFRFESGSFREVFREIPMRGTDGIEVVAVRMDGQELPFGTVPGTVEVRHRRNRVRVVVRFERIEGVTREFSLQYRARGVVRQDEEADVLAWRALPGQHDYRIESSTITVDVPAAPTQEPEVRARRVAEHGGSTAGGTFRIHASGIRRNGWIEVEMRFPRESLVRTPPAWQQRAAQVAAGSPRWIAAAAGIAAIGLVLLVGWRQTYDHPPAGASLYREDAHQPFPPEQIDPALAGVLASNGQPDIRHALATLFALAGRGEIEIREKRPFLGHREFILARLHGSGALADHERTVLETVFKKDVRAGKTATFSQARSRLGLRMRPFSAAVRKALAAEGLLDEGRVATRRRYERAALWLFIAAGAGLAPAAYLVSRHGGWPLLLPAAVGLVALAALIFASTVTPLSNDGLRRASRWRAYRTHLASVARGEHPPAGTPGETILPLAVALGLALAWSKYSKRQGEPAPAWFHVSEGGNVHAAFPALIATGGTSAGGGGGGVAGGGASGAR